MKIPSFFRRLLPVFLCLPALTLADFSLGISIHIGPPALPVYVQPPCPEEGLIWTPGYWAYGPYGYYWVPGVWVRPPQVGFLWTPGYWGFAGGVYGWHAGYWGPHVGFYGGVNYGFGYGGVGFVGGGWSGSTFRYNTAVTNVNTTVVKNVYVNKTVINNTNIVNNNRVSYNGGPGGVQAAPNAQQLAAAREQHFQATNNQVAHEQLARGDRNQLASVNHGAPAAAAMDRVNGQRFGQQGHAAPNLRPAAISPAEGQNLRAQETRNNVPNRPEPRAQQMNQPMNQPMNRPMNQPHPQAQPAAMNQPHPQARPHPEARQEQRPEHRGNPEEHRPEHR